MINIRGGDNSQLKQYRLIVQRGLPVCQTDKRWAVVFGAIEFVVDQSTDERMENRG
jgi:hypothetical protein